MTKLTMKQWSFDDQPREKLLSRGATSLSDAELLAIIIRTGRQGHSALDLARLMIENFGSLRRLNAADMNEWKKVKGLGPAKIALIKAAFELGHRVIEEEIHDNRPCIYSAKDVADLLMPRMRDLKIEVFKVIYLNSQSRVIAIEDTTQGTVNQATPIIREILHQALKYYAVGIICVHNHPSGSLIPSDDDKVFTLSLIKACELMSINFIDHLIISSEGYSSITTETMC